MAEDKTFKSHEIDVAGLFGDKDTGAVANHILSKMKKLDAEGAISGAGSFDNSRIYKHVETGETAHQHFQRTKGRKAANVHELAKHFHENRHQFMGHKKEAGVSKPAASKGYN